MAGDSERRARLIEQMELQLEELETAATEDAIAADASSAKASMERGAPAAPSGCASRSPAHLPRERV
ncbi:IS66 family transposase, partial [Amaricoccus sp. HAR-UPW-R2A-40]